jgi:hypothetical protein
MDYSKRPPTLAGLREARWTKKGIFYGYPSFKGTLRLDVPNHDDRPIDLNLNGNHLFYEDGKWTDATNPDDIPTTVNPVVAENICLKKRVETLIRTAAISEIEVRQLKREIREHVRFYHNCQIFNKPVKLESELSRRDTVDGQEDQRWSIRMASVCRVPVVCVHRRSQRICTRYGSWNLEGVRSRSGSTRAVAVHLSMMRIQAE